MTLRQFHDREYAQSHEGGHSYLDGQRVRLWLGVLTPAAVARCVVPSSGESEARGLAYACRMTADHEISVSCVGVRQRRFQLQVSE